MLVSHGRLDVNRDASGQDLTNSFRMAVNGIVQGLDIKLNDTTWTMIASFEDTVYVVVEIGLGHGSWGQQIDGDCRTCTCIAAAAVFRSFLIGTKSKDNAGQLMRRLWGA
jgi:hypothetical protein